MKKTEKEDERNEIQSHNNVTSVLDTIWCKSIIAEIICKSVHESIMNNFNISLSCLLAAAAAVDDARSSPTSLQHLSS